MGQIYLASGKHCAEEHTTTGILVTPTAGSWECILKDSAAKTVFHAVGATADSFYAPVKITADAFNMTTATQITSVILYT